MRSSRLHTEYLFRLDCAKILSQAARPVFATFSFKENVTSHVEASKRWLPVARYLRLRNVNAIGVWQRQKRGAWHLHLVLDRFVDVVGLREKAVESGWGEQVNLQWIRLASRGNEEQSTFNQNGSQRSVVKYLARYLTRDFQKDFGAQLVVRVRGQRTGNVKFTWVEGASYIWRRGCARYSKAIEGLSCGHWKSFWKHRDTIWHLGRESVFDELCNFFDGLAQARVALAPS